MLSIDDEKIEVLFRKELNRKLEALEHEAINAAIYWDMKDLQEKTRMSVNTIKEYFFYHDHFPKFQVGRKWYFPAKETEQFLIQWLKEQG